MNHFYVWSQLKTTVREHISPFDQVLHIRLYSCLFRRDLTVTLLHSGRCNPLQMYLYYSWIRQIRCSTVTSNISIQIATLVKKQTNNKTKLLRSQKAPLSNLQNKTERTTHLTIDSVISLYRKEVCHKNGIFYLSNFKCSFTSFA